MPRQRLSTLKLAHKTLLFFVLIDLCFPAGAFAWGNNAQRLIVNRAVDTLPYELRPFFENNRNFLIQHVNDPLNQLDKHPNERQNHFIELDKKYREIVSSALDVARVPDARDQQRPALYLAAPVPHWRADGVRAGDGGTADWRGCRG